MSLQRASAGKLVAVIPSGERRDPPTALLKTGEVGLGVSVGVVLRVGEHRPVLRVEANTAVAVQDASLHRHRIDRDARRRERERQVQLIAGRGLPVDEVARAGVAEIVVHAAVWRLAPDPGNMVEAVGTQHRSEGIGVSLALAVEERRVDVPPPGLRGRVENVHNPVAVAALARSVTKHQSAVGESHEEGIGAAILVAAGHRGDLLERRDRGGLAGAVVGQAVVVHVAGQMDLACGVDGHDDVVVAVPAEHGRGLLGPARRIRLRRRQPEELPPLVCKRAGGDGQVTVGVVEGDVLPILRGEQGEADRMTGPDWGDVDRRNQLGFWNSCNGVRMPGNEQDAQEPRQGDGLAQ